MLRFWSIDRQGNEVLPSDNRRRLHPISVFTFREFAQSFPGNRAGVYFLEFKSRDLERRTLFSMAFFYCQWTG